MKKQKLVLIGNGMAGVRCMEEILTICPDGFDMTIFGSEPHVNYNRILLSTVLQGGTTLEEITLNDRNWYERHQIKLFTGETVVKIDTVKQVVITDKSQEISYDRLIIATGSIPFLPSIPGADKKGVTAFRTIEDCQTIMTTAKHFKKAAVIGGGLLGLEAAIGLLNLGMDVSVVHIGSYLLERQLDHTAARMLQVDLENQGMKFLFEKHTQEIIGDNRAEGLVFKDGTMIDTDLVVMAAGVRPNVQLARESGIETNRAILVNDFLQTSAENVYAVGECVEHRGRVYGLVKPLYEQGKIAAKHICGVDNQGYTGSVLSTQLKISGIEVFSAGKFHEDTLSKSIKLYDEVNRIYKKLVFQDHKLIGAVLFGDTRERPKLLDMIVSQQEVSDLEKTALLQSASETGYSVADMPFSELVCNCNGVTKGAIVEAVQQKGLTTVDQVKKCTKASGSCGGCKSVVTELVAYLKSDECTEVSKQKSMCSCTSLTEDEVVQELLQLGITTLIEAIEKLNWNTNNGCSICRPAINYYLGMIYPEYDREQGIDRIIMCIEEYNCQCDKQRSLKLAAAFKKGLEFLAVPCLLKIGVSTCMHNGADSTIKDIGVIRTGLGWEIYAGGSSGRMIQAGELLAVVPTDKEAVQIIRGLIQYYRESAHYQEQIGQWLERMGLIHVREVLFDQELRQELVERLDEELSVGKGEEL
ncbi:nitrite reductase large subunit NirB [Neobacillus drentensis]|uniref:nitrite reductase large subunit NirB n=1 Tax=Neobacillus drentensis TaxID=220684 RepID=UPI001F2DD1E5|nr:nitrite reductase large subunit NirB [Neobacillus drentensis]ULT57008.1 nitrite reductase large subunit NirB [Neobacillus drentensis]